jgi:hypothetical protein
LRSGREWASAARRDFGCCSDLRCRSASAEVRLPVSLDSHGASPKDAELVCATLHTAVADVVDFGLSPPPERTPYKRTLLPDEQITLDPDPP